MNTAPIQITDDGKLVIIVNNEVIYLEDPKYKDCHSKEGFNISKYKQLKHK